MGEEQEHLRQIQPFRRYQAARTASRTLSIT
jgi:hypothetical protein